MLAVNLRKYGVCENGDWVYGCMSVCFMLVSMYVNMVYVSMAFVHMVVPAAAVAAASIFLSSTKSSSLASDNNTPRRFCVTYSTQCRPYDGCRGGNREGGGHQMEGM